MYDIFIMDFGNREVFEKIHDSRYLPSNVYYTRYHSTHLETIRRCVKDATTEFIWVLSTRCIYKNWNFFWKSPPWEDGEIHCWALSDQERGDTFFIPVDKFKEQEPLKKLEWFKNVHYHYPGPTAMRTPFVSISDYVTGCVNLRDSYTIMSLHDDDNVIFRPVIFDLAPCWEEKAIFPLNKSGSVALIPRECNDQIHTQLYDYPYINRDLDYQMSDTPQDIIFISYDEPNADKNFSWLSTMTTRKSPKRVHGVRGMVDALKRAAEVCETTHFFAVFGKTKVHKDFSFDFQPDYLAEPKHYVFQGYNPVLDYAYGHGGVVLYNRDMVMHATEWGEDFTMSFSIQSVLIISCDVNYNTTPYLAWRTAFREIGKLYKIHDDNIEANYRMHLWLTQNNAENGKWSIQGAKDGIEYYHSGEDQMKIFDWEWLKARFLKHYPEVDPK